MTELPTFFEFTRSEVKEKQFHYTATQVTIESKMVGIISHE